MAHHFRLMSNFWKYSISWNKCHRPIKVFGPYSKWKFLLETVAGIIIRTIKRQVQGTACEGILGMGASLRPQHLFFPKWGAYLREVLISLLHLFLLVNTVETSSTFLASLLFLSFFTIFSHNVYPFDYLVGVMPDRMVQTLIILTLALSHHH